MGALLRGSSPVRPGGQHGGGEAVLFVVESHPALKGETIAPTVQETPSPAPTTTPSAPVVQWLQPFPVVRIAGSETAGGARITLLNVTAPVGARVTVSCRGGGCPIRSEGVLAGAGELTTAGTQVIAFRRFQRALRAGVTLEIRVSRAGQIGKFVRFSGDSSRQAADEGRTAAWTRRPPGRSPVRARETPGALPPTVASRQADVGTLVILVSLCAAVFACSLLLPRRAASPRARAPEPTPPALAGVVSGVPVRMSSAPAIAATISGRRPSKPAAGSTQRPVAAVAAVRVASAPAQSTPAQSTPEQITPEQSTPAPEHATPERAAPVRSTTPASAPAKKSPSSTGGPGTSSRHLGLTVYASRYRLPTFAVPLLLAVAVLGYLTGTRHISQRSSAPPAPADLTVASAGDLAVEYPVGWLPASSVRAVPGLTLNHPLLLSAESFDKGSE